MPRGPRGPIEKPKDRKKVLLRLWTYLYAHKWMSLGAVLLTVGSNLLALLGPMLSGRAIDAIGVEPGQADFPTIFLYCGLMVAFYAVSSLLSYILSILMIQLSQKIVFQMRQQVVEKAVAPYRSKHSKYTAVCSGLSGSGSRPVSRRFCLLLYFFRSRRT